MCRTGPRSAVAFTWSAIGAGPSLRGLSHGQAMPLPRREYSLEAKSVRTGFHRCACQIATAITAGESAPWRQGDSIAAWPRVAVEAAVLRVQVSLVNPAVPPRQLGRVATRLSRASFEGFGRSIAKNCKGTAGRTCIASRSRPSSCDDPVEDDDTIGALLACPERSF